MATSARKAAGRAASIALVAGSVVLSLVVLEVGCRLLTEGPQSLLHWPNLAHRLMSDTDDDGAGNGGGGCRYRHDATLGWSLPANCTSEGFNVGADGFRRTPVLTPGAAPPAEPPVLATGSSFTIGIEGTDGETWPARLQDRSGRRVVNAGVSGYSLDQTVLATERLAPQLKPLFIIVGFTPGDIWRTELRVAYSREKPAFAVSRDATGDRLELINVPIPPRSRPALPLAARWLGWSALAHEVVERLAIRDGWYYEEARATPPGTGETISCLLMPRLARLGVPVVVVAQYGRGYWQADSAYRAEAAAATHKVLGCAEKAGLLVFDLAPPLGAATEARGLATLYRSEHHSAEGNRVVADLILRELVRDKLLTAAGGRAE
jgi:hypothetical protein